MAIGNHVFTENNSLAYDHNKTFIPVHIPIAHQQLRHYISSPEKDTLYYASGNEVYHLNTATKKRKHLATLPFETRCTASGHGYVCIGGEEGGHFAAIKLESSRPPVRPVDVDAPLPIEEYWHTPATAPRAANVRVERIGDEIVNSISIHHIKDEDSHLYDVVAVLTNNDKTVRVYSLQQGQETACLHLPFPMNHATISPDGASLVAVGDSNRAFFYKRVLQKDPPQIPKPHNRLNMAAVAWTKTFEVTLRAYGDPTDPTQISGYFTTAWSPSGHLVAVGSEGGHISVFDTSLFEHCREDEGENAIVAVIPSTRPNVLAHLHPGAIRSMMFSPEPWDLLVWAEGQDRLCIADLRTGLRTKQIIELKPNEEGLKKVDLEDLPNEGFNIEDQQLEEEFIRRHRDAPDSTAANHLRDDFYQARERLRQQRDLQQDFPVLAEASASEDDPRGLTAREQQILESLRTTRQRQEARAQGALPRSVNYTNPSLFTTINSRSSTNIPDIEPRPFSDVLVNHSDPYAAFPELSRTSQRDAILTREPERIASDNPQMNSIQDYLRLRGNGEALVTSGLETRSESRRRSIPPPHAARVTVPSNYTPDVEDENPWRTISNAMALARGPLFDSPRSTEAAAASRARTQEAINRAEQLRRIAQQRERLRTIRRDLDAGTGTGTEAAANLYETLTTLRGMSRATDDRFPEALLARRAGRDVSTGVRTAGLAMSQDGATLWAACEDGIFEIEINIKGRMAFPAMEMR